MPTGSQKHLDRPHFSITLPLPTQERLGEIPLVRDVCAVATGYHLRMPEPPPHTRRPPPELRILPDALFHFYPQENRWVETDAGRFTMPANALMCIPAGVPFKHGMGRRKRINSTYWFRTVGNAMPNFFRLIRWSTDRPYVVVEESVPLLEHLQSIARILSVPVTQSTLFRLAGITARLLAMIVEAAQQAQYRQQPSAQRVREVARYLRDHPTADLSLQELASMANLSTQHFRGLFKEQTGYAPTQYQAQIRAQHAARLLASSHDSVGAVAAQLGFEDPLYFSRWFRRLMGVPPRQYAREQQVRND